MKDKKIKIGFISKKKPSDKKVWSGTTYQLYKNISSIDNVEVIWIPAEDTFFRKIILLPFTLRSKLLRKNHSSYFTFVSKFFCKNINKKLVSEVDLLFVPTQTLFFAYLETNKPIIYLTDASFKQIYNYYECFSNFSKMNVKQSNLIHQKAYEKAWRIIVSSNWAKNSLVNDYCINTRKVEVIEFGANIDNIMSQDVATDSENMTTCLNILFLGVDWIRKGGDIAVETVKFLNEMGINSCLHIVGVSVPDQYKNDKYIKEYGFLNKNKEEESNLLKEIISKSHVLILPSKAECSAIALCEASAYGLPSFAYDTGGLSNYVINSKNGYLLNLSATGKDFALKIKEVVFDKNELDSLRQNCFEIYKQKLNWNVWTTKFAKLLDEFEVLQTDNETKY